MKIVNSSASVRASKLKRPKLFVARSQRKSWFVFASGGTGPWVVAILIALLWAALLLLLLVGCQNGRPLRGGAARTVFSRSGHTNSASLTQPENPKQSSRQSSQTEDTLEMILPAGTVIALNDAFPTAPGPPPAPSADTLGRWGGSARSALAENSSPNSVAVLAEPTPLRRSLTDRTDTRIGAAQSDTAREWAAKAASLRPVMWAGIAMMTLVAGALAYFGWWTKAVLAMSVGLLMVVVAQVLPGQGTAIILAGIGVFGFLALLVLYAYYKGQLDQNNNGIPDFLENYLSTVTKPNPPPTP